MIVINFGTILVYLKYISVFRGKSTTTNPYLKDRCGQWVVIVLGVLCLFFGIWGQWIINFLFESDLQISTWGYIQKMIIFMLSLGVGLVTIRYAAPAIMCLEKYGVRVNIGFRVLCASIGIFFGLILIIAMIL